MASNSSITGPSKGRWSLDTFLLVGVLLGPFHLLDQDDLVRTATFGGGRPNPFEEIPSPRAVLVGLKVSMDGAGRYVQSVQAVYRRGKKVFEGEVFGPRPADGKYETLVARDGYAVGGISGRAGSWIDGLSLLFMRIRGAGLDSTDTYESPFVGGPGGRARGSLTSEGSLIVGILGGRGAYVDCLGFVLPGKEKPDGRLQVPSRDAVRESENLLRELFKEDYARKGTADRKSFAAKLLTQARETRGEDAVRFVLLRESREMAVLGEDISGAFAAAEETVKLFQVDELDLKIQVLGSAAKGVKTLEAGREIAGLALELADEALERERFETAFESVSKAEIAARAAKDPGLLMRMQDRREQIDELKKDYGRAKAAEKTLEDSPDDPEANLALGRYLALVKGEWDAGLPFLLKGANSDLKTAAAKDLGRPTGARERVEVGDLWWDAGEKEKRVLVRNRLRGRARYWYEGMVEGLSGINRARVEKRLAEPMSKGSPPMEKNRSRSVESSLGYPLRKRPDDAVRFGNHYYKLFETTVGWGEARRRCRELGGYLACVTDDAEFDFVMSLLRGKGSGPDCCWVGATDEAKEGEWSWITGELFTWKKLDAGINRGENFLNIRIASAKFEDYPDRGEFVGKQMFLCEWDY